MSRELDIKQRAVILKALSDRVFRYEMLQKLQVGDFIFPKYQKVYSLMADSLATQKSLDVPRAFEILEIDSIPSLDILYPDLSLSECLDWLASEGQKQRVLEAVYQFTTKAQGKKVDIQAEVEKLMSDLKSPSGNNRGVIPSEGIVSGFMDFIERDIKVVGRFGIAKLDQIVGGLEGGHVYSIIAGPGVGKTMLGIQVFDESMGMGSRCCYFSTEMASHELVARLVSRRTGYSNKAIVKNEQHVVESEKFAHAVGEVDNIIRETGSIIISGVNEMGRALSVLRQEIVRNDIKVVIIDHLHNFTGGRDQYSRLSEMAHALQSMAQELGVAMVMLAQISSANRRNEDDDLVSAKGANDIEEVSNVQILLRRKRVEMSAGTMDKDTSPNWMKYVLNKHREGETGASYARVAFPSMVIVGEDSHHG